MAMGGLLIKMSDEFFIERGYKEYPPTPHLDNDSIVAKFQKRFDDNFGKKYFIDIEKWSYDYIPECHRDKWWKPFGYSYNLYVTMFKEEKPVFFEFGTSWTIEEVEKFAEDFFEKMKPNYYETWDEC
jgi:hypothetical protein